MEVSLKNDLFPKKLVEQAWSLISKAKNITLLTHFKPDPDGMSSCAAFDVFLKKIFKGENKKNIEIIYPTKPEFEYERIPKTFLINQFLQIPDLIISFDTSSYSRLYYPDEFKNITIINVDHHIGSEIKSDFNFVLPLSSTCELLFYLLNAWEESSISVEVANFLLFGLLADTKIFRTNSTTVDTLAVASKLMLLGADLYKLQLELSSIKTSQVIKFWGFLLQNINITNNDKAVWVKVKISDFKNFNVDSTALVGFVNFLSDFCKNDITALFYENEMGKVQVSLRSKFSDINAVAKLFGGGGHRNASGILTDRKLDEIFDDVTSVLEQK